MEARSQAQLEVEVGSQAAIPLLELWEGRRVLNVA